MDEPSARAPNYEELRRILQKDLGRRVTIKEARKTGKWLLKFYAHLAIKNGNN